MIMFGVPAAVLIVSVVYTVVIAAAPRRYRLGGVAGSIVFACLFIIANLRVSFSPALVVALVLDILIMVVYFGGTRKWGWPTRLMDGVEGERRPLGSSGAGRRDRGRRHVGRAGILPHRGEPEDYGFGDCGSPSRRDGVHRRRRHLRVG